MFLFEVGRLCIKTAGRDAGLKGVVVDVLDNKFVLIDGQTRRRKCNIKHLEPLKETIKLKKKASHKEVVTAFKKLKIEIKETKPKKPSEKPKRLKKEKIKLTEEDVKATEIPVKKETKKTKKELKEKKLVFKGKTGKKENN
ncbi:MAG: 50S ribosomal protein L14e [DPANN group archaeon]|nr:50S ribosomal protein L14e [DPANN group archaeon]